MKKFSKKILAGVAIVVIGVSAIIAGTHSKYFNKITGDGEIEVAKWYFDVNDATETMATIDLAETYDEDTLVNGKIAPGTEGTFDLVINAGDSDVAIDYDVLFSNETNKPTNLKFKCNGVELKDTTTGNSLGIEGYNSIFTGTIKPKATKRTETLTIDWKWDYNAEDEDDIETYDEADTTNGLAALDYTFDVVVTGTQIEPTK